MSTCVQKIIFVKTYQRKCLTSELSVGKKCRSINDSRKVITMKIRFWDWKMEAIENAFNKAASEYADAYIHVQKEGNFSI